MTTQSIQNLEAHSLELYSLAFLLTGNALRSLQVFNRALDHDDEETALLGNIAIDRERIIVEALAAMEMELEASLHRMARPPADEPLVSPRWKCRPRITRAEFEEAVLAIDAFPRWAMLLTIFEGMSLRTAGIWLNADRTLTQAAQRIGIVQLTDNLSRDISRQYSRPAQNRASVPSFN